VLSFKNNPDIVGLTEETTGAAHQRFDRLF